jgi:hypothetical protein
MYNDGEKVVTPLIGSTLFKPNKNGLAIVSEPRSDRNAIKFAAVAAYPVMQIVNGTDHVVIAQRESHICVNGQQCDFAVWAWEEEFKELAKQAQVELANARQGVKKDTKSTQTTQTTQTYGKKTTSSTGAETDVATSAGTEMDATEADATQQGDEATAGDDSSSRRLFKRRASGTITPRLAPSLAMKMIAGDKTKKQDSRNKMVFQVRHYDSVAPEGVQVWGKGNVDCAVELALAIAHSLDLIDLEKEEEGGCIGCML